MNKKILLTGLPRSGKTTILRKVLNNISNKTGFITEEILEKGERTGFKIVTSKVQEAIIASTHFDTSPLKVSRYFVEVKGMDALLPSLLEYSDNDLLYIDEIGQMQLFSGKFKDFVQNYLNSGLPFLGTISKIYEDSFTKEILRREDVTVLEVTKDNREQVLKQATELAK
ncbi:hypothetical protein GW755_03065 [bacterium]|nr:hypothetical protein [bacterium]